MHIGIYILEYKQYICNICNMHIAVPATLSVRLDISEEEGAGGAFVAIAICNICYMQYNTVMFCLLIFFTEESCKPATVCAESETSLSQVPAMQTVVPLSVVVVRQKPPRSVVPSAQEIQEMAARRQTLAFSGDSGSGAEKPVSKRSSMVIPDRPLNPVETENTELAQMFSKFQRRSSQKRQPEAEDSRPVEENNNSGRASENVSQIATDSKLVFAQT